MIPLSDPAVLDADPAGRASVDEAYAFRDIAKRHQPWPEGIRNVGFRFGEDSAGSPAVRIVIVADDDLNPAKERLAAIDRLAEAVRSDIRAMGSERWPYIVIETQ